MELMKLAEYLFRSSEQLDDAVERLGMAADSKVETEREYRRALAGTMLSLRRDGIPMTIIEDIARGKLADLKYERDKAEADFKVLLVEIEALRTKISALQSINKHQSEI